MSDRTVSGQNIVRTTDPRSIEYTPPRTVGRREVGNRPASLRDIGNRGITDQPAPTVIPPPPHVPPGAGLIPPPGTNVQANDPTGAGTLPIYGVGSPFAILSDLFLRGFGASSAQSGPQETQRTIIESVGGSNTAGVVVVLGIVGFAIYWFFIRGK